MRRDLIQLSADVLRAKDDGRPLVALESTIITHGLPYPENLETALAAERIVRENGAFPATIAIVAGRLRAGLSEAEIAMLAKVNDASKASRRDIGPLMAKGATAGTTVAATMCIAAGAGIRIFATGGIGGVHRGAETSFDISADLAELARTRVAVVSAGVKSILDIGKTAEILETLSVPVFGYRTSEFPAFFSRSSGVRLDHRFDDADEVAEAVACHWAMGGGGVLIANPIAEADGLDGRAIDAAIEKALSAAQAQGIAQKDVTPYLLSRVAEFTGGRSMAANKALISQNARVAAEIAVAHGRLTRMPSNC
jgi:pseudouridine-5'-phosphate glycosidase